MRNRERERRKRNIKRERERDERETLKESKRRNMLRGNKDLEPWRAGVADLGCEYVLEDDVRE